MSIIFFSHTVFASLTQRDVSVLETIVPLIQEQYDMDALEGLNTTLRDLANKYPNNNVLPLLASATQNHLSAIAQMSDPLIPYGRFVGSSRDVDQKIDVVYQYYKAIQDKEWKSASSLSRGSSMDDLRMWYKDTVFIHPFNVHKSVAGNDACQQVSDCSFYVIYQDRISSTQISTKLTKVDVSVQDGQMQVRNVSPIKDTRRRQLAVNDSNEIVEYVFNDIGTTGAVVDPIVVRVIEQDDVIRAIVTIGGNEGTDVSQETDIQFYDNNVVVIQEYDNLSVWHIDSGKILFNNVNAIYQPIDMRYQLICTYDDRGMAGGTSAVYIFDTRTQHITHVSIPNARNRVLPITNACTGDGIIYTYDGRDHADRYDDRDKVDVFKYRIQKDGLFRSLQPLGK